MPHPLLPEARRALAVLDSALAGLPDDVTILMVGTGYAGPEVQIEAMYFRRLFGGQTVVARDYGGSRHLITIREGVTWRAVEMMATTGCCAIALPVAEDEVLP